MLNFEQKSIKNMDIEVVLSFQGQNFVNQINHSMLFCWNKKKVYVFLIRHRKTIENKKLRNDEIYAKTEYLQQLKLYVN